MKPLYTRQYEEPDGAIMQMSWGYCREQNAVRLGYAVNILAALVGLTLVLLRAKEGLWICAMVGASFGIAYFAEQLRASCLRGYLQGASIAATVFAYLVILMLALGV